MTHPIPETMKAPRDSRPGVWPMGAVPGASFGGVMQIMVTRACDLACIGCTQGSNLVGKPVIMSLKHFDEACNSLRDYPGVVGVFGGNPCVHPQFETLCEILRKYIPFERRGLWSNNLNGHGKTCKKTFNPDVSNLNVHQSSAAYEEMLTDWPLSQPKGLDSDSRHSPPFVAMQDMEDMDDSERWGLVANCDVNQRWSALIGVFRGQLRGWFCEIAGAQSMLHEAEDSYPDTGTAIEPGWWNRGIENFASQVRYHCMACGHPLRGHGDLARTGTVEQVSKTHVDIYKLKKPGGKMLQLITRRDQLGETRSAATQYLPTERD